jgi:hypothetical protein
MADVVKMANPLRLSASGEPSQGGAMASMDPKSPSRGLNPIPGGVKGGTRRFDVDGDGVPDVDGATKFSGRKLTDFEKSALKEEEALLQMSATETELRMSGKAKRRKGTCCVLCSCRGTVLTALLQDGEGELPTLFQQLATGPFTYTHLPVSSHVSLHLRQRRGGTIYSC